jgi:hypothetical protein
MGGRARRRGWPRVGHIPPSPKLEPRRELDPRDKPEDDTGGRAPHVGAVPRRVGRRTAVACSSSAMRPMRRGSSTERRPTHPAGIPVDIEGPAHHKDGLPARGLRAARVRVMAPRSSAGGVPEWLKGTDCKSVGFAYAGSNPAPSTSIVPACVAGLLGQDYNTAGFPGGGHAMAPASKSFNSAADNDGRRSGIVCRRADACAAK